MLHPADYVLEQPASRANAILSFAVFLPAVCSIFVPIGLAVTERTAVAQAIQHNPAAALQVVIGLALWTLLFVLPVARRLKRFGQSRSVTVANGTVNVATHTLFGEHRSATSVRAFDGIVHRVRTSVGSVVHELALVALDSGHDVVFMQAPSISRETIETALRTLALPELRASDLVRLPAMGDLIGIAPASPRAAAA